MPELDQPRSSDPDRWVAEVQVGNSPDSWGWRSFAHAFTHDILERRRGIEPLSGDWKSLILPLNYRRDNPDVTLT